MVTEAPIVDVVRSFLRAQWTGDRALLARVCRPHAGLDALAAPRAERTGAPGPEVLDRLQTSVHELRLDRHLVHAFFGGTVHLLVVQRDGGELRVDPRYALAALQPDDERRELIRRYYYALLLGDGEALAELAFDPRGTELLVHPAPPPGERGQLEHVAATMGLVRLEAGESFVVPKGVEFVGPRHAELGIEVWSALAPDGEIPFLLRRRDGAWKVIPFHFIQAAIVARGGPVVG